MAFFEGWPVQSEGPWGGLGGNSFTVGPATLIRGLKIKSTSKALFSLTVEYGEHDKLVTSPTHGNPPSHIKVQVDEIKFNHPDEYLQQIEGVTGPIDGVGSDLVTSITFKTNIKTYGPYGNPGVGTHFSSGIGKIVGFWGNSGWALDKIGVHIQVVRVQIQGPWGGPGGDSFDDGLATGIRGFKIKSTSKALYSLTAKYDKGGEILTSPPHGNPPSHINAHVDEINFNYPCEYLQQVEGLIGAIEGIGSNLVTSITFKTNVKTYGPYGNPGGGTPFKSGIGNIVGLWGSSGWALDKIGVYVQVSTTQVQDSMVQVQGPWGGLGGNRFDDSPLTCIKGFKIKSQSRALFGLTIEYDNCGELVTSPPHGNPPPQHFDVQEYKIKFNYPTEYLQQIEGLIGPIEGVGSNLVTSITFKTNVKSYGPYGNPGGGTPFKSGIGKILNFWGSSGYALDRLAVHVAEFA